MKPAKCFISSLLIVLPIGLVSGQQLHSNEIVGLWKSPEGHLLVKIDKIGSLYQGRIAWHANADSNNAPLLDSNNPKPHLRNIPLKGNKMLSEFSFDTSMSAWKGGNYYDPIEGKHYNCTIQMLDDQRIQIIRHEDDQTGKKEIWHRHR
jgi:uncharacterized protein (DUF2147 family)